MRKHQLGYGAVVLTALLMYIVADRREFLVFLAVLVLLPLLGLILQILAMDSVEIHTGLRERCRVNQQVVYRVRIDRKLPLPLGAVRVKIVSENLLYREKTEAYLQLQPSEKKQMEFEYPVEMKDCGNVRFQVEEVLFYDLLGLFCRKIKTEQVSEILVYPAELQMNAECVRRPVTQNYGELYDPYKKGQDVSEVSGIRDYAEGDSLGSIHWKLSGKMDHLIVREFGYPSNYNTVILYDLVKNVDGEEGNNERNNAVLAVTVSLSYALLKMNLEHNVGRAVHGEFRSIPVNSMESQEQMELSLLCMPVFEDEGRSDAIYHFQRSNRRNEYTKVIYVTPDYEEASARQLAREADLTVIHVVDDTAVGYVDATGYSEIPVEVKNYRNRSYNIML